MTLFEQWEDLISNQNEAGARQVWKNYCDVEIKLYSHILGNKIETFSGKYQDLVDEFKVDKVLFWGFLDGISESLNEDIDAKTFDETSDIELKINFEKLYINMHKAKAEHLYTLPEWDNIFTEDERNAIMKKYKDSKTIRKEKTPGRNDPCPCGSGKKYKKCCGKAC